MDRSAAGGDITINRILFNYIVSLDKELDGLEVNEVPGVQESLMVLISAAFGGPSLTHDQYMSINLSMRERVLAYIDNNLGNPELSPATIMQYFKLSRSHLYRAFEQDKGLAGLIRNRRLDLAHRMIQRRVGKPLTMKELAYRCGFQSRSQFTTFFKNRFGVAPQDVKGRPQAFIGKPDSSMPLHGYLAERISSIDKPQ